jgi:predicted amidophosphoribosyltransferase
VWTGLLKAARARAYLALEAVSPPRCLACRALLAGPPLAEGLCGRCRVRLAAATPQPPPPAGIHRLVAATSYRGPALGLVASLKSAAIPAAACTAAELIAERMLGDPGPVALVPVPSRRLRAVRRGIDPATEIAVALAPRLERPLHTCLRRRDGGHQRGRPRQLRLADPPRFVLSAAPPLRALLVDDVCTTGATLVACATALATGGCERVDAAVLAAAPRPVPGSCMSATAA